MALHTCAFTPELLGTCGGPEVCAIACAMSWLAPTPHPAARKSLFTPGVNALKLSGPLWHESSGSPMSARVSAKPGELVAPNPECPRRPSQIEKEVEASTSFRRRSVVQTASERLSGAGVAWATSDRKSSAAVSPTAAKISFQSRRSLSQNHVIRSTKLQRVVTSRVVDDFTQRSRRLRRVHLMSEHKRRIAGALIAVTFLGVIYAVALVEVRLGGLAPVATIDQLRAANLGILALELAVLFEYYRASRAIHLFCSHDPADLLSWIVFDVALLAVGVVPPGVEVDLANPCASELHYECSAEDETLHIDCAYDRTRLGRAAQSTPATHLALLPPQVRRSRRPTTPRHRAMGARLLAALRPRTALVAVPRRGALDVPPQVPVSEAARARPVRFHRHVLVVLLVLVSRARKPCHQPPPCEAAPECM